MRTRRALLTVPSLGHLPSPWVGDAHSPSRLERPGEVVEGRSGEGRGGRLKGGGVEEEG